MAYNPDQPVVIKVEANLGTLGWVDLTSRGRRASCTIQQGRGPNAIQAEPSRLSLTLGNPDGWLTEGNPMSPWYPYFGRGCEIRVSRIGLAVSPAERFHGRIDTLEAVYPGGPDSSMEITAIGTLGFLGQGSDPLHSPLYRAMLGITADDFQAIAYWSCEDGSGATQFASALSGQPAAVVSGDFSPASYSGFAGSSPLPVLRDGQVRFELPGYNDTGIWQIQFTLMIPSSGFTNSASLVIADMLPGHTTTQIFVSYIQSTGALRLSANNSAGTTLDQADTLAGTWQRDTPYLCAITDFFTAGSHVVALSIYRTDGNGLVQLNIFPDGIGNGSAGMPFRFTGYAYASVASGWSLGHVGLYTADVISTPNIGPNARAAGGYVGELAADRMTRLCREAGVGFELTGSAADTPAMGAQLTDTVANNLRDCEDADQGLMHDNGTDGAVGYVTRTHLYNQTATIAVTKGSLEPGLKPIWDNQSIRNDVTSSRPSGAQGVRVSDEAHIARTGVRIKGDRRPNVAADDQLQGDAAWAVHLGTAPGARYNSVGINLRNADGALLADQVAAHEIGDRITVATTALPAQHPIDGIDGLTVGWTELLDVDTWLFRPNVVPYSPYQVGVYDDTAKRYDSAFTTLAEALDTTETGVDIQVAEGMSRWIDSTAYAARFPLDIAVGGERMRVTAATVPQVTFVGAGTAAHADNAQVTPGLPGGWQQGDLLLVYAACRSTTGSPITPAGYTLLFSDTNIELHAKIAGASESAPTVMFSGTVSGDTTSAQMAAFRGVYPLVVSSTVQSNAAGQNIATPALGVPRSYCLILWLGWKQSDMSSASFGFSKISDAASPLGNDQSITWWYQAQTTASDRATNTITVSGVASAISKAAVVALPQNAQTFTVTRSVNGVVKSHAIGAPVHVWQPGVYAM